MLNLKKFNFHDENTRVIHLKHNTGVFAQRPEKGE
jgi:hypothetical protein